jgi:uncharacterized protein DUF4440
MKRCTTCNRTYTDPNLSFCIDDGTPLTPVEVDDDATVVTPRNNPESEWNAVAYQPPRSYAPPGGGAKRRRAWPWIVGILGAFILGILVIGIAAAIMVPRAVRRAEPVQVNVNRVENSNTAPETNNANSNATEHAETVVPTNHDQVLAQLKDIENEWTVANLNADKKKLDRILADDFVGENQGQMQSKADYIRTIERATGINKWEFSNLKLMLAGDRATLTGTITLFTEDGKEADDFTDKFVWRDGRWQATGSEVKQTPSSGVDL